MNRVGVAKLPLSTPAPNASVAAPEDAIRKTADGIIAVLGFRRETCIVPRAMPVNPREMQMDDLFIEIRRQFPCNDDFYWDCSLNNDRVL